MGAYDFECTAKGKTVESAFRSAVNAAQWEYGHGGYTGTIAEKSSFVEFTMPKGVKVRDVVELVQRSYDGIDALLIEWFGEAGASRIAETYDDKWGPAVALRVGPDEWLFCGMASS